MGPHVSDSRSVAAHMALERDGGGGGGGGERDTFHIGRSRDGNPPRPETAGSKSQSQYLWMPNMWHTSLPTNLSHLQIIRPRRDHESGCEPRSPVAGPSPAGGCAQFGQIGILFICFLSCGAFDRAVRASLFARLGSL